MLRITSGVTAAVLCVLAAPVLAQVADFKPVTEEMLANPDPADWLMISRTFDQQRYSPLKQIDRGNVGQLRMAWARGLPAGTQELTRSSIGVSCISMSRAPAFRRSMPPPAT